MKKLGAIPCEDAPLFCENGKDIVQRPDVVDQSRAGPDNDRLSQAQSVRRKSQQVANSFTLKKR